MQLIALLRNATLPWSFHYGTKRSEHGTEGVTLFALQLIFAHCFDTGREPKALHYLAQPKADAITRRRGFHN